MKGKKIMITLPISSKEGCVPRISQACDWSKVRKLVVRKYDSWLVTLKCSTGTIFCHYSIYVDNYLPKQPETKFLSRSKPHFCQCIGKYSRPFWWRCNHMMEEVMWWSIVWPFHCLLFIISYILNNTCSSIFCLIHTLANVSYVY